MWANDVTRVRIKCHSHHWLIKGLNFYHIDAIIFNLPCLYYTSRHVYSVRSASYIPFDCAPRTTRVERRAIYPLLMDAKTEKRRFSQSRTQIRSDDGRVLDAKKIYLVKGQTKCLIVFIFVGGLFFPICRVKFKFSRLLLCKSFK